ncbi:MAG: hypothetical protein V3U75_12960 [Methylococcaceae bacterium]
MIAINSEDDYFNLSIRGKAHGFLLFCLEKDWVYIWKGPHCQKQFFDFIFEYDKEIKPKKWWKPNIIIDIFKLHLSFGWWAS